MTAIYGNDLWCNEENARRVKWSCPDCGHMHVWYWDPYDIADGEIEMGCDNCGKSSKQYMHVDPISGNAWCNLIEENPVDEIEDLKIQIKNLERRLREAVEEQARIKPPSLTQVIKKWEFDFTSNWSNPKNQNNHFYEKEIERLVQMIENWLPDQKKVSANNLHDELGFLGYNQALQDIKNNLRNEFDSAGAYAKMFKN
jgi:predicted  nucleic acid-binding Zn-ribbon protein